MTADASNRWEAVADAFMAVRRPIGVDVVRAWAAELASGAAILDVGAGSGAPLAEALVADGFQVFAVEPSPTLAAAFRARLPTARVACEAAEASRFFDRTFDAAIAIGLLFLLPTETQRVVISRISAVLRPGGSFLFSAPAEPCAWTDSLTGRASVSLGMDVYAAILAENGLSVIGHTVDDGANDYIAARKR